MFRVENAYLFLIPLLGIIVLFLRDKITVLAILKDSRITRVIHYFLIYLFGISLMIPQWKAFSEHLGSNLINEIMFFIGLYFSALFAIVTNNLADVEIDQISNRERPTIRGGMSSKSYLQFGVLFLIISLTTGFLLGLTYFLILLGLTIIYYIYSCEPFRFKRIPILAKLLIGMNHLIICMGGFIAAGGEWEGFPIFWIIFILVGISLSANVIDIKDVEGDRIAGIKTLPVIFGTHRTRLFLSVVLILLYSSLIWYYNLLFLQLLVGSVGLIHIVFLLNTQLKDKMLFLLHNTLFVGLIALQFLSSTRHEI